MAKPRGESRVLWRRIYGASLQRLPIESAALPSPELCCGDAQPRGAIAPVDAKPFLTAVR